MKKILFPIIFAFALVGCTSITTMSPAQFNQLTTTPIPFAGSWTGEAGAASVALSLNRQGSGLLCMDDRKEVMSYRVKLVDNTLYSDKGVKFKVKALNNSKANIHMSLLGLGVNLDLNKDDSLKNATVGCKQVLN